MKVKSDKYEDIINLPHHVSYKHPRMSSKMRAAQFAPFAALTGYEDAVRETARLTSDMKELDEEMKLILDEKIKIINEKINENPIITITFFIPDLKKEGGEYSTITNYVSKIDEYKQTIIMNDKTEISINNIIEIEGEILKEFIDF